MLKSHKDAQVIWLPRVRLVSCILLAFIGCAEDQEQPKLQESTPEHVAAPISAIQGGTVEYDGVRLEIPPGALAESTHISIERTDSPVVGPLLTPVYRFQPEGLRFLKPVTVRFELPEPHAGAVVFWSSADGLRDEPIGGTVDGKTVSTQIVHFSRGSVRAAATVAGHVVVLGYDFREPNAALGAVLGNAMFLGGGGLVPTDPVDVLDFTGYTEPTRVQHAREAIVAQAMQRGQYVNIEGFSDPNSLPAILASDDEPDVLLVHSFTEGVQFKPSAATISFNWHASLQRFIQDGGSVVVLNGPMRWGFPFLIVGSYIETVGGAANTISIVDNGSALHPSQPQTPGGNLLTWGVSDGDPAPKDGLMGMNTWAGSDSYLAVSRTNTQHRSRVLYHYPVYRALCGDGIVDDGETCDDGNRAPGDGCRPDCGLEPTTPANNLLQNAGFETGALNATDWYQKFQCNIPSTCTYLERSTERPQTGTYSVKFTGLGALHQDIAIDPSLAGRRVRLSAYVFPGEIGILSLIVTASGGESRATAHAVSSAATSWQRVQVHDLEIPAGTTTLSVVLSPFAQVPGVAFADNFALEVLN